MPRTLTADLPVPSYHVSGVPSIRPMTVTLHSSFIFGSRSCMRFHVTVQPRVRALPSAGLYPLLLVFHSEYFTPQKRDFTS